MNIIHLISNKVWGGGERYAFDLCLALREAGHPVEIISRNAPVVVKRFSDCGFNVTIMPLRGLGLWRTVHKIAKQIRSYNGQPTTIHVHNFIDARTAIKARKIAGSPRNIRIICTRHLVKAAKTTKKYEAIYRQLDAIIFVSELAMREFLSTKPAIDIAKLTVIHNSIIPPSTDNKVSEHRQSSDTMTRLLFLGRIVPEKGLDTLLRAMASAKGTRLTVCGSGDDKYVHALQSLASELGIAERVTWAGYCENVYSHIASTDIGIVPSKWAEPFGLTIIEFMSQGIPVITSDNGAQREIITDGVDGLLVAPDDPESLAKAIIRLVEDQSLRERIGKSGHKTFCDRFSYDRFHDRMAEVYGIKQAL